MAIGRSMRGRDWASTLLFPMRGRDWAVTLLFPMRGRDWAITLLFPMISLISPDSSVQELVYLIVCPLCGLSSIPDCGRVFQRIIPGSSHVLIAGWCRIKIYLPRILLRSSLVVKCYTNSLKHRQRTRVLQNWRMPWEFRTFSAQRAEMGSSRFNRLKQPYVKDIVFSFH